jgi:ABC-type polysaccharide/polyol phosphate transport system ATPase subunit
MACIRLKNIHLSIPIYDSSAMRLFRLPSFGTARVGSRSFDSVSGVLRVNALRDLSLDIEEGDRVALIGTNGAGKTTLLRLLAGIYPVQQGEFHIEGSIRSLLESVMALNPDATGYENIRLVANLEGWPHDRIDSYIADIESFTQLGEYLSLPIRIYSAGMNARLAFAIATMQSPDILLVDENIGAGDAHFQMEAQERINAVINRTKIMVIASHSMELLHLICNKGVLLNNGQLIYFGELKEAIRRYGLPNYGIET